MESNKVGCELCTHLCCEDVVYIVDPVFFLDEELLPPGASPAVIVLSTGLGLPQQLPAARVTLAAEEWERACQRLSPTWAAVSKAHYNVVWPFIRRAAGHIREAEFLLKEGSEGGKQKQKEGGGCGQLSY